MYFAFVRLYICILVFFVIYVEGTVGNCSTKKLQFYKVYCILQNNYPSIIYTHTLIFICYSVMFMSKNYVKVLVIQLEIQNAV